MWYFLLIVAFFIILNIILNRCIFVTHYNINSKRISHELDNFKIIQLTDIHSIRSEKQKEDILVKVKQENPNIIIITGDLIDTHHYLEEIKKFKNRIIEYPEKLTIEFIKELVNIAKVYYVFGNHEKVFLAEEENIFLEKLEELNVKILNNKADYINFPNSHRIRIMGIQDTATLPKANEEFPEDGKSDFDIIEDALENLKDSFNEENLTILLVHRPEYFKLCSKYKIDLIFSGHTHGGVWRIPGVCGVFAHYQGIIPKYSGGKYELKNSIMIVGRGSSRFGVPGRIFNPPEIISVTLTTNKEEE